MSYVDAVVYAAELENYVLKIRGQGLCDMYIQLPDLNALKTWEQSFNQKTQGEGGGEQSWRRPSDSTVAVNQFH